MHLSAPEHDEASSRERLQGAVGPAYRVGRLLGRGGFGEVFEAEEPRLSRRVAIKVVRVDAGASTDVLTRFQREARAMAGLRHPNVMEVYTVGEGSGLAYFVMPFVAGESLKARLARSGALPLDDVCRILIEASSALHVAHRAGTVHRDVKPDNIMLEGEGARVLITDFGIAKALEADTSSFTRAGAVVGTPTYMSPEQASGEEVDGRSDIYSLGVVAFEMVAGRPPFEAKSVPAMLAKHLTQPAPGLRTLRPDCPARLAHVVERCLAKDPGGRWATAGEIVEALEGDEGAWGSTSIAASAPSSDKALAPVRALRRAALAVAAPVAALVLVDVSLGLGGLSAWTAAVALLYLAIRAGRLWREGYGWGEMLRGGRAGAPAIPSMASGGMSDQQAEEDFGRFGSLVRSVASDRAHILKALAAVSRHEQQRIPGIHAAVEGLVIRAKHLARRVVTIESRLAEAAARSEPAWDADRDSPLSPVQARRAAQVHELGAARDDAAREMHACIARLEDLRDRLSDPAALASPVAVEATARVVAEAAAYLSQRAI